MTTEQLFERDFDNSNFAFKRVISKNIDFKKALLEEYQKTKLEPNFHLFLLDSFSEYELEKGFEEINKNIPTGKGIADFVIPTKFEEQLNKLKEEFFLKIGGGKLELKHYGHKLEFTSTVKILTEVENVNYILKSSITKEDFSSYTEAELRSQSVIFKLRELPNEDLMAPVLQSLVEDTDNIHLFLNKDNSSVLKKRWEDVKDQFNTLLKREKALFNSDATKPNKITPKYTAKQYVLAYIFECNASGVSFPVGNKKELESLGNEVIGPGKGNRFYKAFNEAVRKDLNIENNIIEIGGENWREVIISLSKNPTLIKEYLDIKKL